MYTNCDATEILCRKLLRQAAWRLQYKVRIQRAREYIVSFDHETGTSSFDTELISDMFVKELLGEIPWEKSRYIIQRIVIEGLTEKEVAIELHITQQGVNKWKRKGLEFIRNNLSHSYKQ
jgi:DNA-directed RNA polymerase specialized sigma subunit